MFHSLHTRAVKASHVLAPDTERTHQLCEDKQVTHTHTWPIKDLGLVYPPHRWTQRNVVTLEEITHTDDVLAMCKSSVINSWVRLQLTPADGADRWCRTATNDYLLWRRRVCLLDCQQDYTKTTEWISMKLGWKMGRGPEQTLLTFGVDRGILSKFI